MIKVARHKGEDAKVAIRNVRRKAKEELDRHRQGRRGRRGRRAPGREGARRPDPPVRRARSTRSSSTRKPSCSRSDGGPRPPRRTDARRGTLRCRARRSRSPTRRRTSSRREPTGAGEDAPDRGTPTRTPSPTAAGSRRPAAPRAAEAKDRPGRAQPAGRDRRRASASAAVVLASLFLWRAGVPRRDRGRGRRRHLGDGPGGRAPAARSPPLVPLLAGGVLMIGLAWYAGADALTLGLLVTVLAAMVWRLADGAGGLPARRDRGRADRGLRAVPRRLRASCWPRPTTATCGCW